MKAQKVVELFKERSLTLGAVESMTAGLFSAAITEVPGASQIFAGSLITYNIAQKENLVGISPENIQKYGVISWEVASQMAYNGRVRLNVDYCISVTGNAGPTADKGDKEIGCVYIGIASKDYLWGVPLNLSGTRDEIRQKAVEAMLQALESLLRPAAKVN